MTETTLNELNILKAQDIVTKAADLMIGYSTYPKTHEFLIQCGLGIGQERHSDESFEQKGISISKTFGAISSKQQFQEMI